MIKKGQPWVYAGIESLEWSKGIGTTEKGERYPALSLQEALALYQDLKETSDKVRLQRIGDGPTYAVIAYHSGDPEAPESDSIVDTHELLGNVLQQPIALNPRLHELLTDEQINFVVQLANKFKQDKIKTVAAAYSAITSSTSPVFAGTEDGNARNLFDKIIQGQTSFVNFQWVYRHTVNVSASGSPVLNRANMGEYFETTAILLSNEDIDLPTDFSLPPGAWLKVNPTETKQYGQRTQIVYEYWWAEEIDNLLYRSATA
jgi:hypothetical protein